MLSPSDYRLRRCRKLLRQGPVCLQETKWKGHESEALYQNIPGVKVAQSPAVAFNGRGSTGGVAILFPPGWAILEEHVLVPGRGGAALVQDRTCKFYVVSIYIHPENRKGDVEALLRAWRFLEKKTDYVFLAGDFNSVDKHAPQLWDKFLMQFQCSDVYPELATYRHSKGVSCLDRVLIPDSLVNSAKLFASASVITSHVANGHDIVKARVSVKPNVLNNPRHPKHEVIPSGVFMPGKDGTPVASNSELQSLIRRLQHEHMRLYAHWGTDRILVNDAENSSYVTGRCSPYDNEADPEGSEKTTAGGRRVDTGVCSGEMTRGTGRCSPYATDGELMLPCQDVSTSAYFASHLSIVGCFWSWWRTQLPPQLHPNIRPYCRARKYLSSDAQWVNVPKDVVEDLILASRSAILTSTESLKQVNGCFAMPRVLVQSLIEVIDACVEGIPFVPTDDANMQARGLGTMVAFWERMRNICPKVNLYHGPIYGKSGEQCTTSIDLDEAMLATRDFWFEPPDQADDAWQPILDCYAEGTPWRAFQPPSDDVFFDTLLHTKDSAPGPDGLPYSAWRLLPKITVDTVKGYFYDIVHGTALPPHQVVVWIPKAKMGPEADCFRPLGMPNTLDRLVDGSVAAHAMRQTAHMMHPSQAVMSYFKEPQKAVSCIQRILDGENPAITLLADLSKVFERVNPYWILELLRIKRAPRWLFAYTKFILFHRRVSHKVQGRLLPSRTILQGVDMGRSFSVYLFCLAMDPRAAQLEEAYARATVALTRAQRLCLIMGPLDMKGLLGAATVIGCLKYGAGLCGFNPDQRDVSMHLRESDIGKGPDDAAFLLSLQRSISNDRGVYPPLAFAEIYRNDVSTKTKIRRLHLLVVDLERTKCVSDDVYLQFQKVQVSTCYTECFNALPVPIPDVESPVRCRCVYGYGVDASDRPSYLLWPRRGSDGHFWLMDPRSGKFFDPAKATFIAQLGLKHFFDASPG